MRNLTMTVGVRTALGNVALFVRAALRVAAARAAGSGTCCAAPTRPQHVPSTGFCAEVFQELPMEFAQEVSSAGQREADHRSGHRMWLMLLMSVHKASIEAL